MGSIQDSSFIILSFYNTWYNEMLFQSPYAITKTENYVNVLVLMTVKNRK